MKSWTQGSAWLITLTALCLITPSISAQTSSYVPPIVVTSTNAVAAPVLTGDLGDVALDACGNIYAVNQGSGQVIEIPYGGGSASTVLGANSYGTASLWIDAPKANLFVLQGFSGSVAKIPITNCAPQTSAQTSISIGNLGAISYYWGGSAEATDSAGDVFIATNGACCAGNNELLEENPGDSGGATLLPSLANSISSMTVDATGNIYYASGGGLFELTVATPATATALAVYSANPVSFGGSYSSVVGVTLDGAGNLYVADEGPSGQYAVNNYWPPLYFSSVVYVIPYETTTTNGKTTSALNPADRYIVAEGSGLANPLTLTNALAIDSQGNLYFGNGGASVNEMTVNRVNLGSVAVGGNGTATIDVQFNAAVAPSAFSLVSGNGVFTSTGGNCAAGSYTAGQSCTINAKFAPTVPGVASSGISLTNSNGAAIASAYLQGTGLGAGLTLDSGVVSSVGAGFTSPASIALDAAGDSYIADTGKNAVYEFKPGSTTAISLGAGLSKPSGIVVDGAGNVIIADTGNNRIVEVPIVSGALNNAAQATIISSSTSVAGSKLSGPAGVTVDGQGNLYIADTGNNRIVFVPYNGSWNLAEASVLGSNFTSPLATTVDPWGNLYVADSGSGQIYKLLTPFSGGIQQLVAVGYSNPSALATDASGSLFVVDQGADTVLRIPYVSGSLNPNSAIEVGFGIAAPYGVALDQAGDLYVTDTTHAAAYEVNRVNITEVFGDWALNLPSGALPVKVENEGNQQLTFATPFYTATGNTGDFSLGTPSSECTSGGTLAAGAGCELDAIFQPTAPGVRTETLVLNSNAQNAASSQVVFSGTGISATATTTALAITSPASGKPFFGQPITLTATVTAASGTPSGSAQLLVDGVIAAEATLSSGVGTFSLAMGLTGGSHSLQAVYLGTSSFAGSNSSTLAITVTTAPTTSTLVIAAPYVNPYSAVTGNTVTFTVTINSTGVGIPTGTVTFAKGATTLGIVAVAPASGGAFQASLATTALPVGTDLVTATYSGDANYVTSSASGTVTIVSVPTLITTTSGTNLSGGITNSTVTFSATSYGGWNGMVGFSCLASSLPANARCIWSPGQVEVIPSTPLTSTVIPTSTLTVTIDQPPQTPTASKMIWWLGGVTGLLLFFARRRMTRGAWGTATMLIAVLLLGISASGLVACNSSPLFQTPSGASTITVYASADPFTALPSSGTPTPATQACGIILGSNPPAGSPTLSPCTQQSFQISLTVQ